MKLVDKDVKTAIINSLHMFKKVEKKNTNMTRKEMEDIKTQMDYAET